MPSTQANSIAANLKVIPILYLTIRFEPYIYIDHQTEEHHSAVPDICVSRYYILYYIKQSRLLIFTNKIHNLTCVIIYDNLTQNALEFTALFLWANRTILLYNKQNNTWMFGNMKLFLVLNRISHSFTLLTRYWSTLTSLYYSLCNCICISPKQLGRPFDQ